MSVVRILVCKCASVDMKEVYFVLLHHPPYNLAGEASEET